MAHICLRPFKVFVPVLISCALLTGGLDSFAIDLSFNPTVRVGTRADSNIRGAATGKEAAWGFEQGASLGVNAEAPTWNSSIRPHFNIRRFVVGDNLDADEYGVNLSNAYTSQYWGGGLDFNYSRDSTLATELTDLGVRNEVTNRDTIHIAPNVSYVADDKTSARLDFGYTDTTFARGTQTGFIDYRYMQASLTLNRVLSETDLIFATPYVTDFDSPQIQSKTRTYGGQLGYKKTFTPTLQATATLGFASSTIDFLDQQTDLTRPVRVFDFSTFQILTIFPFSRTVPAQASSDGIITSASIEKKFERSKITLDYSRQISPTARGSQEISDAIIVNAGHDLTERLSTSFYGSYVMASAEGNLTVRNLDRDQSFLQGALTYRLTEHISLQGAYTFAYRPSTLTTASVGQHGISFYLLYDGGSRSFGSGY